jgi:hypothetical protein
VDYYGKIRKTTKFSFNILVLHYFHCVFPTTKRKTPKIKITTIKTNKNNTLGH